jgi:hypothetical protein
MIKSAFWNGTENRLRAGWRVLFQILLVSLPLSVFALLGVYTSGELTNTKVMITAVPITIASVLFLGRYIESKQA